MNSVIYLNKGRELDTPLHAFGEVPSSGVIDRTKTSAELSDILGAGSELIPVLESIEEIDPAIFTKVRNYSFDNISIRMPLDQQYDDSDDYELEEDDLFL